MVLKFKATGKDETATTVNVSIKTKRHVLTRGEAIRMKRKLENRIHEVLREVGYDVNQISVT